jgi:hypothetical protein
MIRIQIAKNIVKITARIGPPHTAVTSVPTMPLPTPLPPYWLNMLLYLPPLTKALKKNSTIVVKKRN